jgi:4'-phosphopantetheinyl transferase
MMDPSVPSPFRLKSDQVDIWIAAFSIVSDDMQLAYRRLLSEAENARSQRFVPQGARHQYLVGRALVRAALSKYTNTPEQQWVFETNAYGRPYVAYPKAFRCLQFSLSQTQGMVACAIAKGYGIGIDVEKIRSDVDPMTLAPSSFCAI